MKKLLYLFTTLVFAIAATGIVVHFPAQCTMKVKCQMSCCKNNSCTTPAKTIVIKLKDEFIHSSATKTQVPFQISFIGFLPYRNVNCIIAFGELINSYHSPPSLTSNFTSVLPLRC